MFGDEDAGKAEGSTDNDSTHTPPWKRRKRFLDAMKAAHDKNSVVYFNVLGAQGYQSADEVPEGTDHEDRILSIIQSEIPG